MQTKALVEKKGCTTAACEVIYENFAALFMKTTSQYLHLAEIVEVRK